MAGFSRHREVRDSDEDLDVAQGKEKVPALLSTVSIQPIRLKFTIGGILAEIAYSGEQPPLRRVHLSSLSLVVALRGAPHQRFTSFLRGTYET